MPLENGGFYRSDTVPACVTVRWWGDRDRRRNHDCDWWRIRDRNCDRDIRQIRDRDRDRKWICDRDWRRIRDRDRQWIHDPQQNRNREWDSE